MIQMTEKAFADLADAMVEVTEATSRLSRAFANVVDAITFDDYVTQDEACRMTSKTPRQIRYLADSKKVEYRKTGERGRLYRYSDLKKYINISSEKEGSRIQ